MKIKCETDGNELHSWKLMNAQVYAYHRLIGNSWDLEVGEVGSGD